MDRRLEKTLKEELKLKEQMKALQDKLDGVEEKREIYEKETLYKNYKETEISLEEYQIIIKSAVDDYMGIKNVIDVGGKHEE
jgi:hypothetical protein